MKRVKLGKKQFVVMTEEERKELEKMIRNIDHCVFIHQEVTVMYEHAKAIDANDKLKNTIRHEELQAWMNLNDAIGNAIYKIRDI